MNFLVPLESMQPGQSGSIESLDGDVRRLEEMGLLYGARVKMVRPGRPCILAVGDQRLSLRLDRDTMILVDVGGSR
jgi:Fe2+ transport system protein FeoA